MADLELRKQWVAALRGGTYLQTEGALHKEDKFCCLGVLCDLVDHDGWGLLNEQGMTCTPIFTKYIFDGSALSVLPKDIAERIGLRAYSGNFYVPLDPNSPVVAICEKHSYLRGLPCSLTELNDQGATFAEIADIIDAAPQGLFD